MAKILALDDVPDAVQLIKRVLDEAGHEVFPFTEEASALEHIKSHHVDLVILDVKLKRMSGMDVLSEIKRISPGTRVIMLTAYPSVESAQESLKRGAHEYCVKPIDLDDLTQTVDSALCNFPALQE